jgi:hypothetical protein
MRMEMYEMRLRYERFVVVVHRWNGKEERKKEGAEVRERGCWCDNKLGPEIPGVEVHPAARHSGKARRIGVIIAAGMN